MNRMRNSIRPLYSCAVNGESRVRAVGSGHLWKKCSDSTNALSLATQSMDTEHIRMQPKVAESRYLLLTPFNYYLLIHILRDKCPRRERVLYTIKMLEPHRFHECFLFWIFFCFSRIPVSITFKFMFAWIYCDKKLIRYWYAERSTIHGRTEPTMVSATTMTTKTATTIQSCASAKIVNLFCAAVTTCYARSERFHDNNTSSWVFAISLFIVLPSIRSCCCCDIKNLIIPGDDI